ncbi:hypothetical protein PRIC1_010561 [Phytophthora ramorum]
MAQRFPSGISRQVLVASLLVVFLATASAADQPLDLSSILRDLSQNSYLLNNAMIPSTTNVQSPYRRLDELAIEAERAAVRASGVGAYFSNTIKQIRGATDEFYHNLITALKITLCEHGLGKNSVRFVASTDDIAYKTDNGDCVQLTVSSSTDDNVKEAYNSGLCEVQPNCYWAPIEDGDTNRGRVYADPNSPMRKNTATAKVKEWAAGAIGFVIPGIVLGVLSLLTMNFFLICRCCCNRCGGRYPRKQGYTRMQKFLPVFVFLIFAIGVFVVSTAALLYRNSILGSVDDIFNATSGALENGSDWVVSIRNPLRNVRDMVDTSVVLVIKELNGSEFIEDGVHALIGKLREFGENSANRTLPDGCTVDADQSKETYTGTNGNICLPCDVCTTISTEIDKASDEIEAKAEPSVQQLITVRSQINHKLVSVADAVRDAVNSKVQTANDLIATLGHTHYKVSNYDDTFQSFRDQFGFVIMNLFYLAGGVIALSIVGIVSGLTSENPLSNTMHVAYFFGFIMLFVIFVTSSVVLALGIVLGDACEMAFIFSSNWTVPLGNSARAVDACFQNESLLDVFNLSSQLAFARGGIKFPTIEVGSTLDLSALDNFSAMINATAETAFAFNETRFDEIVQFINTYATQDAVHCKLSDKYTKENALEPWLDNNESSTYTPVGYIIKRYKPRSEGCAGIPDRNYGKPFVCTNHKNPCAFSAFMGEQFRVLVDMATIRNSVYDFVTQLQQNVTDVVDFSHEFKTNVTNLMGRIETIKNNLESSLIKYVDDFEKAMYCTFIADGFFTMYGAICGSMVPSITMIGIMQLAVGIFFIPMNICLIIGVKRLKARRFRPILVSDIKVEREWTY